MLRLLRSTSVQLALGYAVLIVASSLLLVGLLWWRTAGYLEHQTDAVIRADTQAIEDTLRNQGLSGAVATIEIKRKVAEGGDRHAVYLLADAGLRPLAGNLAAWPPVVAAKPGWHQVPLYHDGRLRVMEIEETTLPGGYHLLVGRDIANLAEFRALLVDGLGWAAAGAFVLAIAGGLWVRRAVLRRIEVINRTAGAIVRGDLSRRLPARETTDEFDQLAQTINAMLFEIENLVEGVRNTSNAVAHDLRTPLAELRAQLEELLRTRPSRAAMLDGIHKAVADIDRLIEIFNALLRLVEIDSGERRSGFREVDPAAIATEVAELYAPLAEERKTVFVVAAHPFATGGAPLVNGDPHLLAQAVANLVDNALKHTPSGGAVALRTRAGPDGSAEIVVTDNGPGIADAEKPKVTRRFYRGGAQRETAGLGLGLSVVDAVARLHDGLLTFADNDPGLIATLTIPAAGPAPKPEAARPLLHRRTRPASPLAAQPAVDHTTETLFEQRTEQNEHRHPA